MELALEFVIKFVAVFFAVHYEVAVLAFVAKAFPIISVAFELQDKFLVRKKRMCDVKLNSKVGAEIGLD